MSNDFIPASEAEFMAFAGTAPHGHAGHPDVIVTENMAKLAAYTTTHRRSPQRGQSRPQRPPGKAYRQHGGGNSELRYRNPASGSPAYQESILMYLEKVVHQYEPGYYGALKNPARSGQTQPQRSRPQ